MAEEKRTIISTKTFVEKLYSAKKRNTSVEEFAKSLGITVKQVEAKRNNINGQFSKAGKEIRLPALKSKPVLSIDELADFCNELSKPKEKKPSSKDKKTSWQNYTIESTTVKI